MFKKLLQRCSPRPRLFIGIRLPEQADGSEGAYLGDMLAAIGDVHQILEPNLPEDAEVSFVYYPATHAVGIHAAMNPSDEGELDAVLARLQERYGDAHHAVVSWPLLSLRRRKRGPRSADAT